MLKWPLLLMYANKPFTFGPHCIFCLSFSFIIYMEIELQIFWQLWVRNSCGGYIALYFANSHMNVENLGFLWAQSLSSTNLATWQPPALLFDENKQTDVSSKYNCCAEMCPSSRFTFPLMKHACYLPLLEPGDGRRVPKVCFSRNTESNTANDWGEQKMSILVNKKQPQRQSRHYLGKTH